MSDGRDAVLAAVGSGDGVALRTLLAAGPALAATRDDAGVSVLLLARYRGDDGCVDVIRATGLDLDVFEAAALGEVGRLDAILDDDAAAIHAWSGDGFTALHLAAFFGGGEVARRLLDAGADPDAVARNPMAVRPLHSAVAAGQADVALMLIAAGAEVDARQRHGWTPLHGAAQGGMAAVVAALLAAGADPAAVNDDGVDAVTLAERHGHAAVASSLREAMAARG